MNKFAGEPEQKAGDQVRGTEKAKKSKDGKHPFLKRLVGDSKEFALKHKLIKEFDEFKHDASNPKDVIKVDVPLLIRLLEYAREDAKTDMDLHNVAERLINLSSSGEVLGMDNYDDICKSTNEAIDPPTSQGAGPVNPGTLATANAGKTTPAKPGDNQEKSPADLAKEILDQQNLIKNLNQLKAAGVNVNPNQAQKAFTKADTGVTLNPTDKDTVSKLAPAVGDIIANPQLAGQFKSLVQKAQQQNAQQDKQQQTGAN
jgi:hypothetical protein